MSQVQDQEIIPADIAVATRDGLLLHGQLWSRPDARLTLVVSHGVGDHGGAYVDLARAVSKQLPVEVVLFDYRGFGRSPGKRGYVHSYDDFLIDLEGVIRSITARHLGKTCPIVIFGHSNGSLLALRWSAKTDRPPQAPLHGLILSCPPFALRVRIPPWKRLLGEILLRVAPRVTLSTDMKAEELTADPASQAARRADSYCHNKISAPLFFGMLESGRSTQDVLRNLNIPLMLILGMADPVIDPHHARNLFDQAATPDKTLHLEPDMRHEPHHEVGCEKVYARVIDWLSAHPPSPSQ